MSTAPRRRFGQHFLHDSWYINQILNAVAATPNQQLVEIGPGRGAITIGLLRAAKSLDVIELDRDLLEPLATNCNGLGTLRIHNGDALKFDFCALLHQENNTNNLMTHNAINPNLLRVVGNLPYNISTPLLFHLIKQLDCIADLNLLLQKEVVERLVATPGSKIYGRLSVMTQIHCCIEWVFDIPPTAFKPIPKVNSSFVRLRPYREPKYTISNLSLFTKLVTQAFSQRRKKLRNALQPLLSETTIRTCNIDSSLRPEQLTVMDFVNIANTVAAMDYMSDG